MADAPPDVRTYEASAASTGTFGRVEAAMRHHRLTVDGPVQNGAPGEAPTPAELLLAAAASCGAELMEVLARQDGVPFTSIAVAVRGTVDRGDQPRAGVTVFTRVEMDVTMQGPSDAQAAALVAGFQARCPVYGSLAVASGRIDVRYATTSA